MHKRILVCFLCLTV